MKYDSMSWPAIILSAILSFGIAKFYNEPIHWYLFILLICIGLLINTMVVIIEYKSDE